MQRDDDVLEEDHVLVSQRDSETTDDTGQDVQQLSCSVEFVNFVDQGKEALVDCLPDHLSSRNQFGVQLVEDVLQVISLYGLL